MVDGEDAGTLKLQFSDPDFWPEIEGTDSAFIHRLAVRRRFAGKGVSTAMLDWVRARAKSMGLRYLRLDCDARRPKLRSFYEAHGYRYHSEIRVRSFLPGKPTFDAARYEIDLWR